ncbi:hypothetical protein MTX26_26485 [Bradyrhizobium sp. ISRA443]|uniref:hypothetical protein n=1 Tax=unclassified Bradyrhizobium TaxID=2631580 RepID=UPI002478B51C|nr:MULTISPECIES: hypothetical protein [unclassified Bradyrhizobium]WGR93352.1 hypothetical protein MTX20_37520 [Bradyrhizobium sp. ISRA435]WGR97884.1 hypothetical protein MTX23_26475 [Bradyrhizobium sp. ISRA436]WGS04774.1 hypothetical protein MTX18_26485 [Bradyrhizobium sp. ISRA437]WGS11655.1 hypothetical protein MTX26_26485 [Bradyrhizobium sp. ISRA443]
MVTKSVVQSPFVAIVFIATVVGGLAILLTNLSTIYSVFVVDQPAIQLELWMAGEIPNNFEGANKPAFNIYTLMLRKFGSVPLYKCRFEGEQNEIAFQFLNSDPFTHPVGELARRQTVFVVKAGYPTTRCLSRLGIRCGSWNAKVAELRFTTARLPYALLSFN